MLNFCIVDEAGFSLADSKIYLAAITDSIKALSPWGFDATVTWGSPKVTDWPVYITTRNRHIGAAAYHTVEHGVPSAYCLPGTLYNRFGTYRAAKPKTKWRAAVPEYRLQGTLAAVIHEIVEMLGDPLIATASMPDTKGRKWLREIADPVAKQSYAKAFNGQMCIMPDVVLPSFYDVNGKAPFSLANSIFTPFTLALNGYAYEVKADGTKSPII